jgi:hypothetical protein
MSYFVRCYTLFDITYTAVLNRGKPPPEINIDEWTQKRNTQVNFDTILQAVSLRSQPEIVEYPKLIQLNLKTTTMFGFIYNSQRKKVNVWTFLFGIQHHSVFDDGITELGWLYKDCHGIPMLKSNQQFNPMPQFIDASNELRNIYFEVQK